MSRARADFDLLAQRGYRFAMSLTHDPTRAADLVQDAWLAMLTSPAAVWSAAYVFVTIRNRFIDEERRHQRVTFEPLDDVPAETNVQAEPSWNGEIGADVSRETLFDALGVLSAEERAALYLQAVEDYSVQQLAELLNRPRGTVMSLLHRARRRVQQALRAKIGQST